MTNVPAKDASPLGPAELRQRPEAFYALYEALRSCRNKHPDVWDDSHCSRVLTSIMGVRPFSWRVVGITKNALAAFHEVDFRKKPSKPKVVRGHIQQRFIFTNELLARRAQTMAEFIEFWLEKDLVVLTLENRHDVGQYIPIENDDGNLFTCEHVSFQYKAKEKERLRSLYEDFSAGKVKEIDAVYC
jgi:hypothetical protein